MTEKKFLEKLGIDKAGHYNDDGDYVIEIDDSNEYGRIFSILTSSDLLEEDNSEGTNILVSDSYEQYFVPVDDENDFTLILHADLDEDSYELIVEL